MPPFDLVNYSLIFYILQLYLFSQHFSLPDMPSSATRSHFAITLQWFTKGLNDLSQKCITVTNTFLQLISNTTVHWIFTD